MYYSKLAEMIKLADSPIAVLKTNRIPEGAIEFKKGLKKGCVIGMMYSVSKGKNVAFSEETTPCMGGKVGLGFCSFKMGRIEYFLSNGEKGGQEGEYYKKSPELAKEYIDKMPKVVSKRYLVLKPLEKVEETEDPEAVIFFVNADQMSGLATMANYDQPEQDNVKLLFGSGCAQSILYVLHENETRGSHCYLGMTDPSARKVLKKDLLSFSIPYHRFIEMERQVEESFLVKETWEVIRKRME